VTIRFEPEVYDYLTGKKFSNALAVNVQNSADCRGRIDILRDLAKGKNVLHIGCADHIQIIEEKRAKGEWLHEHLTEVANVCAGIDIDRKSIDYLRDVLGVKDVHAVDVKGAPSPVICERQWDYAILGEILEHVNDPCSFLRKIRENYGSCVKSLVITVPNALSSANIKNSGQDREYINSDHRYWFTPYTLAKVSVEAGYTPKEFYICGDDPLAGKKSPSTLRTVRRMLRSVTGRRYIRGSTIIMILE